MRASSCIVAEYMQIAQVNHPLQPQRKGLNANGMENRKNEHLVHNREDGSFIQQQEGPNLDI